MYFYVEYKLVSINLETSVSLTVLNQREQFSIKVHKIMLSTQHQKLLMLWNRSKTETNDGIHTSPNL